MGESSSSPTFVLACVVQVLVSVLLGLGCTALPLRGDVRINVPVVLPGPRGVQGTASPALACEPAALCP